MRKQESQFLEDLGRRVRDLRALRGMSRKVLAEASKVSERYIAELESGRGNISVLILLRLANAMAARAEDLLSPGGASGDALIVRDLLRKAGPAELASVKAVLSEQPRAFNAKPPRIALIGLRGAGKSTLGRLLAEKLGWPFVELNKEIEASSGLSIAEVMALYGQDGLRRMEQRELKKQAARREPVVLAAGGGIVSEPLTFDMVLNSFTAVWLTASPEEHMARVRGQGDLRPMGDSRSAMNELRAILKIREPLYARADIKVSTSGLGVDEAGKRLHAAAVDFLQPRRILKRAAGRG